MEKEEDAEIVKRLDSANVVCLQLCRKVILNIPVLSWFEKQEDCLPSYPVEVFVNFLKNSVNAEIHA